MAQVAHRAAYDHFVSGPMSPSFDTPASPASALVQLPRKLARPQFTEVSRSALGRAHPELADVPLEYVRSGLRAQATQMLSASKAAAAAIPASAPRSSLPAALALPPAAAAAGPSAPTHVLALSAPKAAAAALFPTHHLVLLASCALLPALPAARAGAPVPLVALSLPAPEAFAPLHAFLYTHSSSQLIGSLLGLALPPGALAGSSARGGASAQLSAQLAHALVGAAAGDLARLMGTAKRVNGVWKNACALGVYDLELWDALDAAWDAVLGALNLVVRA